MVKRKSIGGGVVLTRARGGGSVARASRDCTPGATPEPREGILEGNSRELCELVDGECIRTRYGFDAETEASEPRALLVPYDITTCPATALLVCRRSGLLKTKLAKLPQETAAYLYLTTLTRAEPEN